MCPLHAPHHYYAPRVFTTTSNSLQMPSAPLSDSEVDRIADRVVEKLRVAGFGKTTRTVRPDIVLDDDNGSPL